jgi:hypothetical protein
MVLGHIVQFDSATQVREGRALETKDYITLGVSLLALVISLGFSWISLQQKSSEAGRIARDQLTDALSRMYAIITQVRQLSGFTTMNPGAVDATQVDAAGYLNQQLS